jgi:methionyl-tRNA formyltransferase
MAAQHRIDSPPRVALLTSPGLFGAEIINCLVAARGIKLVGVGLTNRLYKRKCLLKSIQTFRQRTGWKYLLYNALQADLAWTWLRMTGRPAGLKRVSGAVKLLKDVNSSATIEWLRELRPDYLASYFFNQIIGPEVRAVPTCDAVNMHPSLLPALKGPDPIFQAIDRGLCTSGYTIHRLADQVDGGQVLYQTAVAIPQGLSAFALYLKSIREGSELLAKWLAGTLPPEPHIPLASEGGDYSTFPTPHDVDRFLKSGHRLIRLSEWHRALAEVR